jgi:predicted TIM-barrel enzyme
LETTKSATDLPVEVASGASLGNVGEIPSICDELIVASSPKRYGVWWNEVDLERVRRFIDQGRAGK